jgi:hypothetical protein
MRRWNHGRRNCLFNEWLLEAAQRLVAIHQLYRPRCPTGRNVWRFRGALRRVSTGHASQASRLAACADVPEFGEEDPVGKDVRLDSLRFTVLGVLKAKGQSATGQDQDDFIILPYSTAMA